MHFKQKQCLFFCDNPRQAESLKYHPNINAYIYVPMNMSLLWLSIATVAYTQFVPNLFINSDINKYKKKYLNQVFVANCFCCFA